MKFNFERLIESSPDLYYRYEFYPIRKFSYVSSSAIKITGYSPEEHYADPDLGYKLIVPEDRYLLEEISYEKAGCEKPLVLRWQKKDGTIIWTEQKNVPVYNHEGMLVALEGLVRDITSQVSAENAQRESEEKFKLMFEKSVLPKSLTRLSDGVMMEINQAFEKTFGYQRTEILGKTLYQLGFNQDLEKRKKIFEAIERNNFSHENELELYIKSGKKITCLLNADLIEVNREKYVLSTIQDITKQKEAEDLLHKEKFLLKTIIDTIPVMIMQFDPNTQNLFLNKEFEKKVGWKTGELEIPELFKKVYPDHNQRKLAYDYMKKPSTKWKEFELVAKNGSKIFSEWSNILLHDKTQIGIGVDITDFNDAIRRMRESETGYRYMFENNPQPMWIYDQETLVFLQVNNAAVQHYGYSRKEFLTMTIADIRPDEDKTQLLNFLGNSIKTINYSGNWRHVKKNGELIRVEVVSHAINYNNRMARHVLITDVTEKMRTEDELKKSEAKYKFFFERDLTGDYLSTIDGRILDCNPAFAKMLGYDSVDEVKQKNTESFYIHSGDRDIFLEKLTRERILEETEIDMLCKNGDIINCIENVIGIFDDEGKLSQLQGYMFNITERKKANQLLEKAAENWKTTFNSINDGIMLLDEKHNIIMENKANLQFYPKGKSITSKKCYVAVHGLDCSIEGCPLSKAGTSKKREVSELVINGMFCEVTVDPIFNEQGHVVGGVHIIKDITDRKRAENEIIKARDMAEESERLKTSFLMNMSHEIRTPMNGILGFMNLLGQPDFTEAEKSDFIEIVNKSGERLLNTINDIIEISKIEIGDINLTITQVNIAELLCFYYDFFRLQAEEKGLSLVLNQTLSTNEALIKTDKQKLDSIFMNLIKNAIKFTESGKIEFGNYLENGNICFYVSDTGIGIPNDKIEVIFDRFVQAEINLTRGYEGSGIGLSIVKAYVEALDGHLEVKSTVGTGSTFLLTFPYKPTESAIITSKQIQPEPVHQTKLKILVAEDEDINYLYLDNVLARHFDVLRAVNGLESIKLLHENPDISLVLMDIKMPGEFDGLEATRKIRALNSDLPIIAQTAYATEADRERALNAGCNDYISKPFTQNNLLAKIRAYLR